MRASLVALVPLFAAGVSSAQEQGLSFKPDLSYYETRWGMKVRSISPPIVMKEKARVSYVLVFDKEVLHYELDDLRRLLFEPRQRLHHIFFDEDDIAIDANSPYLFGVQGQVSGVKGEAIRVIFEFGHGLEQDARLTLQKARKLIVRPPS